MGDLAQLDRDVAVSHQIHAPTDHRTDRPRILRRLRRGHDASEKSQVCLVTFRVSRSKTTRNVLRSRATVCLCVCVSVFLYVRGRMPTVLHAAGCNVGQWWGFPPILVHYWADLQSMHGMRCYGNIMEMRGRAQR